MRKRLGLTIEDLSRECRLEHGAISQLERDKTRPQPWVLGRILRALAPAFQAAFPDMDPYDFIVPVRSFGSWLKNFRLRRGLKLKDLAKALQVRPYTIIRYEADLTKPDGEVRGRLRRVFGLNGEFDQFLGAA